VQISGYCDPAFTAVREAFAVNFDMRGEVGASCCIIINGKTYVDIWGGHRDAERTQAWQEDTLSVIFSNAKAATALCAHVLIERGHLDPDARVTDYWPEFGQHGKDATTVRMMLAHQSAVPALRAPVKPGGYYDFDYMAQRLAAEVPFWEPGTDMGYHSLGTFFRAEISGPLGLDFHIGLPKSDFDRVAPMIRYRFNPDDPITDFSKLILADRTSIPHLAFMNNGRHSVDSADAWQAEYGGGGGIGHARALAQMYDALISSDAVLPKDYVDIMRQSEATTAKDLTLQVPTRFAQGFMLRMDNRDSHENPGDSLLIGDNAFGHTGMGGSVGFADPEAKMSFGYTMTKMGGDIVIGPRGQSLIDAAYACV